MKKEYTGLDVMFIPIKADSIVTTSACSIVSVQYYVEQIGVEGSTCVVYNPIIHVGEGYSYNWNEAPSGN